jgi:Sec-independent protein secretion pathway component TatC
MKTAFSPVMLMNTRLNKTLHALAIPAGMLAVWLSFFVVLWASAGALRGYPALLAALLCAGVLWWRALQRSRRHAIVCGIALLLALAPPAFVILPMTAASLDGLPANLDV